MNRDGDYHSRPSVSVVIPTYNCVSLLPNAIRSAYAQTLAPLEVIVVDDGCADGTAEVLGRLAPTLPGNFTYRSKTNGGEASARNAGVSMARGDFVAFLDQDDIWLPDKLERQMSLFEHDPSLGLAFTALTRVAGGAREVVLQLEWDASPEAVIRSLMVGCVITPSTVIVRRDVLAAVGPFDESLWLGNDWELWLRIAVKGYRVGYLPEPLTDYYWHTTNMSRDRKKISAAAEVIFSRLFLSGDLPPSLGRLKRSCLARWRLSHACYCLQDGDGRGARQALLQAFRTRPLSVRPGWISLYLRSLLS
jgi:glycosyltransferase involved in cell wall biosynthesis